MANEQISENFASEDSGGEIFSTRISDSYLQKQWDLLMTEIKEAESLWSSIVTYKTGCCCSSCEWASATDPSHEYNYPTAKTDWIYLC